MTKEPLVPFKTGDSVVKNEEFYTPSEFDTQGRGVGIGIVLEVFEDYVDVRWPAGICYEDFNQIKNYHKET